MIHRYSRVLVCLSLAACTVRSRGAITSLPGAEQPNNEVGNAPKTIPAMRTWTGTVGPGYIYTCASKIVTDQMSPTGYAYVLREDLAALTGCVNEVKDERTYTAVAGDMHVATRSASAALGPEGYEYRVASPLRLYGKGPTGTFYATRTMLQHIKQTWTGSSAVLASGSGTDNPAWDMRGLLLDLGRKKLSVAFIKSHIRDMAYTKMNFLLLTLADYKLRLQITSHSELVPSSAAEYYSQAEMTDIKDTASRYHVQIMPSIDMPGHSQWMLDKYNGTLGRPDCRARDDMGVRMPKTVDITNATCRTVLQDVLQDVLDHWFSGSGYLWYHAGLDEATWGSAGITSWGKLKNNANTQTFAEYATSTYGPGAHGSDVIMVFANELDAIVRGKGKNMAAWGDVISERIPTNVGVRNLETTVRLMIWNGSVPPQVAIDRGYTITNNTFKRTYVIDDYYSDTSGKGTDKDRHLVEPMYETWTLPDYFGEDPFQEPVKSFRITAGSSKLKGTFFHMWNDSLKWTENTWKTITYERLRVMAQVAWGTNRLDGFSTYSAFNSGVITPIGRAPSF